MHEPPIELATEWFDGRSPRPHRAWVKCAEGTLFLRLADEPALPPRRYAVRQVRWPERRTHGMRQTELPDGSVIQHADANEWDAWAQANGLREGHVVGWMQSWRGTLGAMVGTAAVLAGAWVWGVPWLSTGLARMVPPSVEQRIGEVSLRQLRALLLKPSQVPADQQALVRQRFESLVQRSYPEGDAPHWRLAFHASPALGANAFALPGGDIVITDELIQMMADVPDATLGVLAHELGHVHHRHGLDLMVRASLVSALVGLVVGDASGFLATVPATLATQAYSRDAERQADAQAAAMLYASGISPKVMARFFERLQEKDVRDMAVNTPGQGNDKPKPVPEPSQGEASENRLKDLPIAISSHPDHAERIRYFNNWTPATK